MAAPASVTIKSLDGKWVINKTHSDPIDPVLALQGVGWLTRKAVGLATVTQHLTTSTSGPSPTLTIDQVATGGLKGTKESRVLDWEWQPPHTDWLFGTLKGKSRYTTLAALAESGPNASGHDGPLIDEDRKFLCEGWLPETKDGEVIESFAENEGAKWTGWQVWGFGDVDGQRWFVRRFVIRRIEGKGAGTPGTEVVRVRLCYEWAGDL
ncbi:hypothetical protein B0J11DRAFT_436446 [Dendryphion nanum]|uniref:Uncharacterized protein n=1 Tax=Dendryphion nanum TaxID=256645 RepID=A0A9P9DRB1_9PLEO|nr:hypothetical protein B0J11DRAFT_436446 [Dendryphion nanum]